MPMQYLSLVVVCITVVSPSTIVSPGIQRKNPGESCTFSWTVQGIFESYSVNKSTEALGSNAKHTRDDAKGIVVLTISNVQLSDAGNYTLLTTVGTSITTDSGALLFVYGNTESVLIHTNGSSPATEGSSIELTCTVSSSSLPAKYRPKINYFWRAGDGTRLQSISNGPAKTLSNGDLLVGYSIKNDGSTLVVDSVQYHDLKTGCCGREEGTSNECHRFVNSDLKLHYRPQVLSRNPPSRRFHVDVGNQVHLSLGVEAVPPLTSGTWIFNSSSGVETPLTPDFSQQYTSLTFVLALEAYYGTYAVTMNNAIGSTTETFQVLPPAPSDAPSHLKVVYVIHRLILLEWNCMWFNGRTQTVSVQLKETAGNSEIETRNITMVDNNCYNNTQRTLFERNIRPETSYEVSIWSSNSLGSSEIVKLAVTTPKRFKFQVSSDTIAINAAEATINFKPLNGDMTRVSVTCCSVSTAICESRNFTITNAINRIVYVNLPDGDVYLFDFVVYGGERAEYYLTMVKGIRASRTGDDGDASTTPFIVAISILSVLLGIAVLALVGGFFFFRVKKSPPPNLPTIEEKEKPPRELPKRPRAERKSVPPVTKKPTPDDEAHEETYEIADASESPDDRFYMPLNEKPTRAKKNQYI